MWKGGRSWNVTGPRSESPGIRVVLFGGRRLVGLTHGHESVRRIPANDQRCYTAQITD